MSSDDTVIDCRHLCFEYPAEYGCPAQRVLNGVNLRLRRSRTLGLLGMNECGKTTLARVLLGHRRATSGSVRVFGEALESVGRPPRWSRDARLFLLVYSLAGLLIATYAFFVPRATRRLVQDASPALGSFLTNVTERGAASIAPACALPALLGVALLAEAILRARRASRFRMEHCQRTVYLTAEDSPGMRKYRPTQLVEDVLCDAVADATVAAGVTAAPPPPADAAEARGAWRQQYRPAVLELLRVGGLQMYDQATGKPWGDAAEYIAKGLAMGQLSGGQRHLIHALACIARCSTDARHMLLICDEPLCGLDLRTRARVLGLVRQRQARHGFSCLYMTCEMAAVQLLPDEVGFMTLYSSSGSSSRGADGKDGGRIVDVGPRDEKLARPEHASFRRFLDASRALVRNGNPAKAIETEVPDELAKHFC